MFSYIAETAKCVHTLRRKCFGGDQTSSSVTAYLLEENYFGYLIVTPEIINVICNKVILIFIFCFDIPENMSMHSLTDTIYFLRITEFLDCVH
jgi:hypothetical protein